MRILHVLAPARFGGLEQVVQGLAVGHHRRGHDVRVALVVGQEDADHPMCDGLRTAGVSVDLLQIPPRGYVTEWRRLRALFSGFRPDVVHTHGYRTDLVAGAAARRAGLFTVSTAHGFTGGGWKNRTYEWLQRQAWKRFGRVAVVSERLRAQLVAGGVDPSRVRLIRNAWAESGDPAGREEAKAHLGMESEAFRLAFIGRLSHEKGLDVAIRAVAAVEDPQVVLAVVGDGPEGAGGRALAESLGCADRVEWHGMVDRAGHWMKAFDALVLSSRTEGTPIVLLEAMAAEVPAVVTRVGGVPQVVGEKESLMVPSEDADALAEAVRILVADPAGARERAQAAKARLSRDFAVEPWLEAYETLYASS